MGYTLGRHRIPSTVKNADINVTLNNDESYLLAFSITPNDTTLSSSLNCNATFTVDTSGYVVNSAFAGNLSKSEIDELNYYLSRLSKLTPYSIDGEKFPSNINITIFTFVDTAKNNGVVSSINYRYIAANAILADSIRNLIVNHIDTLPSTVQIEAKFPGGRDAWIKYLERNLNQSVAVNHGAPNGIYTVTVSFVVDASGNISEVQALNDPGYGTADEAIRVIKKGPPWAPAIKNGRNVIYRQKQNISFEVSGF